MSAHTIIAVDEASQLDAEIEAVERLLDRLRAMRDARQLAAVADEPGVMPASRVVSGVGTPASVPQDRPDVLPADDWIELHVAAKRFGILDDKLRRWCRNHDVGKKFGGRWMVSVSMLREHMDR